MRVLVQGPHRWLHKAMDRSVCSFITSCKASYHSTVNLLHKAFCSIQVKHPPSSQRQLPDVATLILALILAIILANVYACRLIELRFGHA